MVSQVNKANATPNNERVYHRGQKGVVVFDSVKAASIALIMAEGIIRSIAQKPNSHGDGTTLFSFKPFSKRLFTLSVIMYCILTCVVTM